VRRQPTHVPAVLEIACNLQIQFRHDSRPRARTFLPAST
jgi:hypothetical protein